jgi:hypothetical protein
LSILRVDTCHNIKITKKNKIKSLKINYKIKKIIKLKKIIKNLKNKRKKKKKRVAKPPP